MYNYETEKSNVLAEENQKQFLQARDIVSKLPSLFMMEDVLNKTSGSSWLVMAYVDRLAELGEIREIKQHGEVPGQHRVFKKLKL